MASRQFRLSPGVTTGVLVSWGALRNRGLGSASAFFRACLGSEKAEGVKMFNKFLSITDKKKVLWEFE